jgi:tetratricopeptide (TPR) repeat protein
MDSTSYLDPVHILKLMGLLLAAVVLGFIIRIVWVGARELAQHAPEWIQTRLDRDKNESLNRPNTWTDILRRREFLGIADWFIVRFTMIGIVGVVAAGGAAWLEKDFALGVRVLALSVVFGGASMVGGWLFGLLFGVPRTVARIDTPNAQPAPASGGAQGGGGGAPPAPPPAAAAANRARASGVNTNLTDISDWLTKTIVGVGLTQLYQVPAFLWSSAGKLNKYGFDWDGHGQLLALALFIYFAVGGFWLGYVATRTVLTELLNQIDGVDAVVTQTAVSLADLNLSYSGRIEPAAPGSLLAQADTALLAAPRESLTTPLQIAAWGAAQARAGRLDLAQTSLEYAHAMLPDDPIYRQLLAKIYAAQGNRRASQQLGPDPWLEVFNSLYEPPPEGFTKAIEKGEALAAKERAADAAPKSASLHLWLACAYGQKYLYEKGQNAIEATLTDIKTKALAHAREAIDIDRTVLPTLRSVWNPASGAEDDDLAVFKDDQDFRTLLAEG